MSVFVVMRIKADPQRATQAIGGADWQSINRAAKENGALHHQFLAAGGETIVLDEWESHEGFERFFHNSDEVRKVMEAAGVTEQPQIEVWQPLETDDKF